MSLADTQLPSDPDELRAFALKIQAALQAQEAEIYAKTLHIEQLKAQLAVLRRARFGRSSEKLDTQIEQLELLIENLEEGQAESLVRRRLAVEATRPAPKREPSIPVRKELPAHLPREVIQHEAPCACPACGSTRMTLIGKDERELYEYVPASFKVVRHVRPKMSCRDCETITQPPMPSLPIERGIAGPGLLAHVIVSKYCDHLPLYRQSAIYARAGVDIDRSTMADWNGQISGLLQPLVQSIVHHVRAGETLHADDTIVPVLEPGLGQAKKGRLWVLLRDERSWGSRAPPAVFYRYATDRTRLQADALLKDCRGFLHADGYEGFKKLYAAHPITGEARLTEVACWAHARRYFCKAYDQGKSPAAYRILQAIGTLFAIEEDIKGRTPEERLAVRQELAAPLLAELKETLEKTLFQVSRKIGLGPAILYSLTRWTALTRYTTDGRLEISNNAAERATRPVAIGRKNWMFAGADSGGERAATMYTIIESAKLNSLDPESYLRAVVSRIADHSINRIDELLPWNMRL